MFPPFVIGTQKVFYWILAYPSAEGDNNSWYLEEVTHKLNDGMGCMHDNTHIVTIDTCHSEALSCLLALSSSVQD